MDAPSPYCVEDLLKNGEETAESIIKNKGKPKLPSMTVELCECEIEDVGGLHEFLLEIKLFNVPNPVHRSLFYVHDLRLADNKLGTISSSLLELIKLCPCLRRLNLARNRITTIPKGISRLKTLQTLNLQENYIQELPDDFLRACPSLLKINMKNNRIDQLPEQFLATQRLMEVVNLAENNIRTIATTFLSNASDNLRQVTLNGNPAYVDFICSHRQTCSEQLTEAVSRGNHTYFSSLVKLNIQKKRKAQQRKALATE